MTFVVKVPHTGFVKLLMLLCQNISFFFVFLTFSKDSLNFDLNCHYCFATLWKEDSYFFPFLAFVSVFAFDVLWLTRLKLIV